MASNINGGELLSLVGYGLSQGLDYPAARAYR